VRSAQPPRRFVLATTNPHKAAEIAAILAPLGIALDLPADLPPVVEDGLTFAENAYAKAASAARASGRPAIADDSGLVVEALGGEPGVRSARYAGEGAGDAANVARLLAEASRRGLVDPSAAFLCHAVAVAPDGEVLARAEGRVEGSLRGPPRGAQGFGYDPVFHWQGAGAPPEGCRFAELPAAAKDAVSHRGLAFRALARALRDAPTGRPRA
jgi:XTP/dITP diphosphohydrolase